MTENKTQVSLANDTEFAKLSGKDKYAVKEFAKNQTSEKRQEYIEDSLKKENHALKNSEYLKQAVGEELPNIIAELDAIRKGDEANGILAEEVTIEEYLHGRYGIPKSLDAVYELFSTDPMSQTFEQFMTSEDMPNSNLFVPEIILSLVKTGRENDTRYSYRELINRVVTGERTATHRMPILDPMAIQWNVHTDGDAVRTDAMANFREKQFGLKAISTGFRLTDNVKRMTKVDLMKHFFEELGYQENETLKAIIVTTLLNGDGLSIKDLRNNTDEIDPAVSTIGVNNIVDGITYKDLALAWVTMGEIGNTPTKALVGKNELIKWSEDFAPFNNQDSGTPKGTLNIRANLPVITDALTDPRINDTNQTLLIDRTKACNLYKGRGGMRVEMERSKRTEMNEIYVRDDIRVVNIWSDARLLIDGTLDIVANPYPQAFTARTFDIEGYF